MHPKNTTAPPGAQVSSDIPVEVDIPRGSVWYCVDQILPNIRIQGLPIFDKKLAIELRSAIASAVPDFRVIVQACAGDAEDLKTVAPSAARNRDLIISCRSAERPGHEYLARLGQFGAYDPHQSAPQKEAVPFRGAELEGEQ
jgi:hypothetical protein